MLGCAYCYLGQPDEKMGEKTASFCIPSRPGGDGNRQGFAGFENYRIV